MWASTWSPAEWIGFFRAICQWAWSRKSRRAAVSTGAVRPAANLQRLEEVIVLLTLHPLEQKKEPPAASGGSRQEHRWDCRGDSMMNDAFDLRLAETHIEVHKFRSGAIVAATFLSLILQVFVPVYIPKFAVLDLPLIVTIILG